MNRSKKLLSLLLAVLLVAACLPLSAAAESVLETEPNDQTNLANPLIYGQAVWGEINPAGESDYYKFQPQRDNWGLDIATEIPITISTYDTDGNEITSDEPQYGNVENFTDGYNFWSFTAGQTYYIKITGAAGQAGEYCLLLGDFECPFTDIANHWGRDAIEWAYGTELFFGQTETSFGPQNPMNRGMLATVLWRMAGKPSASAPSQFTDLKSGAYYEAAVNWAAEAGVVSGTTKTTYNPNTNITREQLAAMLYRYAKLDGELTATGDLSQFTDSDKVSSFAWEAMSWAVGEGIVSGKGNGLLDPTGPATRAEVASMLRRFAD